MSEAPASSGKEIVLEVQQLRAAYGELPALRGISLRLERGETLAVIGANGAGKSTLLKTLAGQMAPTGGRILYNGDDITRMPAHERARAGIILVPEGRRLFPSLTVEENLLVGASTKRRGQWNLESVYALMPLVAERRSRYAGDLSGGERQATAIARALMSNPEVLLLDEVSLGLAPAVIGQLYASLPEIQSTGTSILVVEQDVRQALAVSDEVHCLLQGATSLAGSGFTMDEISAAYFGAGVAHVTPTGTITTLDAAELEES
ncbi:ABC transporter ATP-binding protein [Microcella flavibacter]|uniref:ABC transporter ATP-binding protein n=1 Tax=Microcella flavibacter TaxID=1804990 RepID=UPI00145692B7|nr:ABC transporter ATP-binding protein [Microcella flavibacter]